jgi:hypothetical protein
LRSDFVVVSRYVRLARWDETLDRDRHLITLFVREFNHWTKSAYLIVSWPDLETRNREAVDALARDKVGRELAIEHTLLQPFVGDREDAVSFLRVAGRLDRCADPAEPNWMINLVFKVGAIPKRVDWTEVGQRLEQWFVAIRPLLSAGRAMYEVDALPFALTMTVIKSPLPNSPGKLFVMRTMPEETVEAVLRTAPAAKVPKLVAMPADERVLLLEMDSPVRGYREVGETIDSVRIDFPGLSSVSSIWIARTVAWESEGYIGFHLIWPLDQAIEHQEWYKGEA